MRSSRRLKPDDVLVGHSGGGFDATLAADAAPDLVSHIVYLAAALPREGRTYPEAMAMRDSEEGEFDADVGEMLGYLKFDDDGAMWFADFDGAWKYFYHDCDEATARWAFERLGPERFGDTTVTPVSVPHFWAADLPRSFIRCLQDQSMPQWLADTVTRRLGSGTADDRHVTLTVSESTARTGRVAGARHDDDTDRPLGPRLKIWGASRRKTAQYRRNKGMFASARGLSTDGRAQPFARDYRKQ